MNYEQVGRAFDPTYIGNTIKVDPASLYRLCDLHFSVDHTKQKYHLHHINLDTSNNSIQNLIFLPVAIHYDVHRQMKRGMVGLKNRRLLYEWLRGQDERFQPITFTKNGEQVNKKSNLKFTVEKVT